MLRIPHCLDNRLTDGSKQIHNILQFVYGAKLLNLVGDIKDNSKKLSVVTMPGEWESEKGLGNLTGV
jgi:hypothetical protein